MSFQLFNYTDGILASPNIFDSADAAMKAADRWKRERAGMTYRTASGQRIDPEQVIIEVMEISGH